MSVNTTCDDHWGHLTGCQSRVNEKVLNGPEGQRS